MWDDVRRHLDDLDTSVAPRPRDAAATVGEMADAALSAARGPVTLVAHSAGGVVAAAVMAAAPERVTAVLGVSAVLPRAGGSFLGELPLPQRAIMGAVLRRSGTRPPERAIRTSLTAGLGTDVADRVVAEFAPEALALFAGRVGVYRLPPRAAYVITDRDSELPLRMQRRQAQRLGGAYAHLPTGHLPMLEAPGELARILRAHA